MINNKVFRQVIYWSLIAIGVISFIVGVFVGNKWSVNNFSIFNIISATCFGLVLLLVILFSFLISKEERNDYIKSLDNQKESSSRKGKEAYERNSKSKK